MLTHICSYSVSSSCRFTRHLLCVPVYLQLSKCLQKWLSRNKDSGLLGVYSLDTDGHKGKREFSIGSKMGDFAARCVTLLEFPLLREEFLLFLRGLSQFLWANDSLRLRLTLLLLCCCCLPVVVSLRFWGCCNQARQQNNCFVLLKTFTDEPWLFLYYDQLQQGAGSCDRVFRQATLVLLLVLGTFSNTYRWHYLQFPKYFENSKNQVQESLHMNRKWHSESQ